MSWLYAYLIGFVAWFVFVVLYNSRGHIVPGLGLHAFVRAIIWPISLIMTIIGAC